MIAKRLPGTVHFNEGAINLAKPLAVIRAAQAPGELRLLASSAHPRGRLLRACDYCEVEPAALDDESYVAWCLDFAQRHAVDVLIPGRRATALAAARERFAAGGIEVLSVARPEVLAVLASKTTTYERLAPLPVRIPDYAVARSIAEFDAALAALSHHETRCYKPAVSVYGLGFRVLAQTPRWRKRLRAGDRLAIDPAQARQRLARQARFNEQLVMQYLPGPERSVDCLAWHGELLRLVVRRKPLRPGGSQVVERHPEIEESVRRITAELGLHGVFNVQFRDHAGVPYLLEINPRMSGGLTFSCRAGVPLPYWAIRLALGTASPGDVPYPGYGMRVGRSETVTSLCEHAGL